MTNRRYDAIVVRSGHNGLSAACSLARSGKQERRDTAVAIDTIELHRPEEGRPAVRHFIRPPATPAGTPPLQG